MGGAIIAKRGVPEIDDSAAIQRIADLLASDSPPKFCRAIRTVAAQLEGEAGKHYSRLRKKYRRLEECGLLPKGGDAARLDRRTAELRSLYAQRDARIEKARQDLAHAEEAATALGIDVTGDLVDLKIGLSNRMQHLDLIAHAPIDLAFETYRRAGIEDPDEAAAKYQADMDERQRLAKLLKAIAKVRELRDLAGVHAPFIRPLP